MLIGADEMPLLAAAAAIGRESKLFFTLVL
jgi:hypothetical protein